MSVVSYDYKSALNKHMCHTVWTGLCGYKNLVYTGCIKIIVCAYTHFNIKANTHKKNRNRVCWVDLVQGLVLRKITLTTSPTGSVSFFKNLTNQ